MSATPVLEVRGASSTAPDGTSLLNDVTFAVEQGWLVAVVGPTGAGKTSLAKALLGQLDLSSGSVRVTTPAAVGPERHGRVGGVPQDDATHPQLSLRRTLDHAAALRAGARPQQRRQRVDAVLAELGLTGRAGTRLSDLSGGERKRANVAVELLGEPDLLVLDEPTAGLDPGFEKSVFTSLRALADTGRTIVAITHSVRVLSVCDRVLFLARGGTVAFFGTPDEAAAYFDWEDPADAYAALSTDSSSDWRSRFAAHQARTRPVGSTGPTRLASSGRPAATPAAAWTPRTAAAPPSRDVGDRSGHLGTLLHRAVHLASSDRRTLGLSLAAGPALGVLLWAVLPGGTLRPPSGADGEALVSAPKAATFAFFLAMTITWLGAAGAAREVVKERHILRREVGAGVSLTTYLTGKVVFLSGLTALQVLPLAAIALVNQQVPGEGPALGSGLVEVVAVALLVGVAAVATGLLVSSWASSSEKAMTALPVVLIAQLALAGPWAERRGIVVDVLRLLVPAKWAATAVAATVLGDGAGWWLGVGCLAALVVVQLGAARAFLQRSAPVRQAQRGEGLDIGTRLAATRPSAVRLVPAGLALVLALAAGVGALSRTSRDTPQQAAAARVPAPSTSARPSAPPAPTAAPAAVPTTAAAPSPATTVRPAPTPTPPVAPSPVPRTPPATTPRTSPAPTTPPTTRPATPPTTARPTPTTAAPPAVVANPYALPGWILSQIFQPQR